MKNHTIKLILACLTLALVGAACEPEPSNPVPPVPPGQPTDTTGNGNGTGINTPRDSILPPYIEKWIWVGYHTDDGCGPLTEMLPPPEDFFGADARAITIDWRDSTYTSQHCRSIAGGYTNYNISGIFSMRDTTYTNYMDIIVTRKKIILNNSIAMCPLLTDWFVSFGNANSYGFSHWAQQYIERYNLPINLVVSVTTNNYEGHYNAYLYFIRITSQNWVQHYEPANKNQPITFNQNKNQFNQPNYQPFKTY